MKDIQQLLIGSMLGDGYLTKIPENTKQNSRLSIAHSVKQKEYITYKFNILFKYNLSTKLSYNKIYNERYLKGYIEEYRFKSRSNKIFTEYRNLFYINNKKKLHFDTISKIDNQGLAIWLFDDMHKCSSSYQINTQCFDMKEISFLRELLNDKFKLKNTYQKFDNIIYIRKQSRELVNELIAPYTLESMKYKLHMGSV